MAKNNIPAMQEGTFFAKSGNNTDSGLSLELPKRDIQNAIDAVTGASALNIQIVSSSQGGAFTTGFVMADFVFVDADNVTLNLAQAVGIEVANGVSLKLAAVNNAFNGGTCVRINGKTDVGLDIGTLITVLPNMTALEITGNCDNLFLKALQFRLLATSTGSTCIDFTGTSPTPVDLSGGTISLEGNDQTFFNYNPSNATDVLILENASLEPNGTTGSKGFIANNGTLILRNSGSIDCEQPIRVKSGATVIFSDSRLKGDIIVETGGTLIVDILDHPSGIITNNGTINGRIGDTLFGDWKIDKFLGSFDANNVLYLNGTVAASNSRNDRSVIKFPNGVTSSVVREMVLSSDYADGDSSVFIRWAGQTATSGNVVLGVEIEFIKVGVTDLDSDSFAAQQTVVSAVNGISGIMSEAEIPLTKAQADNWEAGGDIRVRVSRLGGDVLDTMTGILELKSVSLKQS